MVRYEYKISKKKVFSERKLFKVFPIVEQVSKQQVSYGFKTFLVNAVKLIHQMTKFLHRYEPDLKTMRNPVLARESSELNSILALRLNRNDEGLGTSLPEKF